MEDFFTYVALFSAALLLIWLLLYFYKRNLKKEKKAYSESRLKKQRTESGGIDFVRCPMCNTPLAQGEDMTSRVFRPMNTPDQRMTILGCPHCYPSVERGARRTCPVCRKDVPLDGYLIARLFNKENNKKHVIITGCTLCYGPQKKQRE
jgi:hypothetical protein